MQRSPQPTAVWGPGPRCAPSSESGPSSAHLCCCPRPAAPRHGLGMASMKPRSPLPTPFGSPPQPPSLAHSHPHLLPGPTDRATELPKLVPRAAAAVGGKCRISGPTQDHLSQSLYFNGTPRSFTGLLLTATLRPASPALGATVSPPLRSGCTHLSTSVPLSGTFAHLELLPPRP